MAEQLSLDLHVARPSNVLRLEASFSIDWQAVNRRAVRLAAAIAGERTDGARDGFALRRYADDAALLEVFRSRLRGKHLKRAARKEGRRLPVSGALLYAMQPEGRRLHALVDALEERLAQREALTLCG